MHKAMLVILDEHRSLAAVLHGLRHVAADIVERGAAPDFRLLESMVAYIEAFPDVSHHPKEDQFLFRLLRQRAPDLAPTLDELSAQHRDGHAGLARVKQSLAAYRASVDARRAADGSGGDDAEHWRDINCQANAATFRGAVETYAEFHWQHMRMEEEIVLPRAEKILTAADWAEMDAAFAANNDPLHGARTGGDDFRSLFTRIVNLTPAPLGLGPAPGGA
ncbi:MAG: hemerythrin domain-containing protein [Alphaproteobacteria bacterium]|nr:hemerythrin domain-containing protein [Alphaproteobacteria bacterium]